MLQEIKQGLHVSTNCILTEQIAGFDLDWTLVRSLKDRFPVNSNDWKFMPNVLSILKCIQEQGYTIVIFTNQGYSGYKLTIAINRINNILTELTRNNIYPWVFAATGRGSSFRKPCCAMYSVLQQYIPNIRYIFYVGDAAGRIQDYDDNDKVFANNIGAKFFVPQEIFPQNVLQLNKQTIIICVGNTSSQIIYHDNYLSNYIICENTYQVEQSIINNVSIFVIGYNNRMEDRMKYIDLAIKHKVLCLILYFVNENNKDFYKNLVEPTSEYVPVVEIF